MASIGAMGGSFVKGRRDSLEQYGDQLLFYVKALAWAPRAVKRYPREIVNTLAEITFGAGGLTLIAGTVGVIAFLAFFAGTEVGIQGYASLSQIGVAKFSALCASYLSPRLIVTLIYGQAPGTYDHYFIQFLPPVDMLWSFGKLMFLAVAIILIHCYYGYTASGGPAGVGMAVGRAIRTSIVTVVVADFFLSFAIWGSTTTVRITG